MAMPADEIDNAFNEQAAQGAPHGALSLRSVLPSQHGPEHMAAILVLLALGWLVLGRKLFKGVLAK